MALEIKGKAARWVRGFLKLESGTISTGNASTTPLLAGVAFPGAWEDVTDVAIVYVNVKSDQASVTDGLEIQASDDGTNVVDSDVFTISANTAKTFSFQASHQYMRVKYTNGGTDQTTFNLTTKYLSVYGKPSSHRIQDSIIDEDDAELTKAVLTGKSSVDGITFENVSTYREALDVNSAWLHRKIINETFHQHTATTTTLNSAASEGDTSISVADTTGFAVGEEIKIEEGSLQEAGTLTITVVAAGTPGTLTLDRPLGHDYTTSADVTEVLTNMAVSGTLASPEIFLIHPPPGTIWQITRILISITDASAMDDGKFGGIAALTNGVSLVAITSAGRTVTYANWKVNGDLALDMYDVTYTDKAPAGENGLRGRWTFTRSEVVAELDGDATPAQSMQVWVQDDLTDNTSFKIRAQGRVFKPL